MEINSLTDNHARTAVIVSGGLSDPRQLTSQYNVFSDTDKLLIAADRGLECCDAAGLVPDIIVGDFDSVDTDLFRRYQEQTPERIDRYPSAKDQTDTELAFTLAVEHGAGRIILMGVTGTRLDHTLANLSLLKRAHDLGISCVICDPHDRIHLADGTETFVRGEYPFISFLPCTDTVEHVTLTGFRYPLTDYTIRRGEEDGHFVSNEISEEKAILRMDGGLLLVVEARD